MSNKHPYPAIAAGSAEDRLAWLAHEAIRAARAWAERVDEASAVTRLDPDGADTLLRALAAARRGDAFDGAFVTAVREVLRRETTVVGEASAPLAQALALDDLRRADRALEAVADLSRAVAHRNWTVARHY